MIEKKSPKGNLDKRRSTFLLIGLILALLLVYAGFELYTSKNTPQNLGFLPPIEIVEFTDVLPTDPPPPPPPPVEQPRDVLIEIVDKEINTPDISKLFPEYKPDESVPDITPVPPVHIEPDDAPPIPFPEVMPEPVGGFEALYIFLKSNLKYPEHARYAEIQGTVLVSFVVEKDGSISNVKVESGVFPALDQEAVRVVKMFPKWKPGKQNGLPVRCLYSIPIRFIIH